LEKSERVDWQTEPGHRAKEWHYAYRLSELRRSRKTAPGARALRRRDERQDDGVKTPQLKRVFDLCDSLIVQKPREEARLAEDQLACEERRAQELRPRPGCRAADPASRHYRLQTPCNCTLQSGVFATRRTPALAIRNAFHAVCNPAPIAGRMIPAFCFGTIDAPASLRMPEERLPVFQLTGGTSVRSRLRKAGG
jgi:hypothetical protein